MPQLDITPLLDDLSGRARETRDAVQTFRDTLSPERLLERPGPDRWSVAECIEHLNVVNEHYVDAAEASVQAATPPLSRPDAYRPGWILGNRLVDHVHPRHIERKMSAPSFLQPADAAELDAYAVLDAYLNRADRLLHLLDVSYDHDIGSVRVPSSFTRFIQFKLGDILRMLVFHDQRHLIQAKNALDATTGTPQTA